MAVTSTCRVPACGTIADGRVARCPRCGSLMFSSRTMRVRGAAMLACGVFLVGFIAAIPALTRMFMSPSFKVVLPEDPVEGVLLLAPVGLVAGFGLIAAIAGGWQMVTGRTMRHLHVMLFAIIAAIVLVFGLATIVLDGDAPRPTPQLGLP